MFCLGSSSIHPNDIVWGLLVQIHLCSISCWTCQDDASDHMNIKICNTSFFQDAFNEKHLYVDLTLHWSRNLLVPTYVIMMPPYLNECLNTERFVPLFAACSRARPWLGCISEKRCYHNLFVGSSHTQKLSSVKYLYSNCWKWCPPTLQHISHWHSRFCNILE
jgi:hypothetical protein